MRLRSGLIATGVGMVLLGAALRTAGAPVQLHLQLTKREVVERRLRAYSRDNRRREMILKNMFNGAGCGHHLSEEPVKHVKQPDLICVLPGASAEDIIVGAHFDHVAAGDGVVDNWSGASLLPSLYQALRHSAPRHTFIFIAFSGEEKGELGSQAYVQHMSNDEVARTLAMINMDSLGLGPSKVWLSHADPRLATSLSAVAYALRLPLGAVNVENVGTTDSEQFAKRKIPRITIHSVTAQTWPILHSDRDNMKAIRMDDYYDTYHLLQAYLAYLDDTIESKKGGAKAQTGTQK